MAYKVFISHSTADMDLVHQLMYWLDANGIETHAGMLTQRPDVPLLTSVRDAIETSDCVLGVLTVDGARSDTVNQEIGYATRSQRLIVPIVELGVHPKGFLADNDYITFDPRQPENAINEAVRYLYEQKLSKESQEKARGTVLFALGLMALAAAAAASSRRDLESA